MHGPLNVKFAKVLYINKRFN